MKLLVCVLLGVLLAASAFEDEEHHRRRPKFCGKNWCPKFWTVAKRRGYEVRCYAPTTWALTMGSELNQKQFKSEFWRLFKYIKGNNAAGKKYPMTVPVITGNVYNLTTHKTKSGLGFWIPTCRNSTAPAPKDDKVFIHTYDKFCTYVRSYGGYSMGLTKWDYKNLYWLSKFIKASGKSYVKGISTMAGYNGPKQKFFRHNEVWRRPSKKDEAEYLAMVEDPAINYSGENCPAEE